MDWGTGRQTGAGQMWKSLRVQYAGGAGGTCLVTVVLVPGQNNLQLLPPLGPPGRNAPRTAFHIR